MHLHTHATVVLRPNIPPFGLARLATLGKKARLWFVAFAAGLALTPIFAAQPVPSNLGNGLAVIYSVYLQQTGVVPQAADYSPQAEAASNYLASALLDDAGRVRVLVHLNGTQSLVAVARALNQTGKFSTQGQSSRYRAGVVDGFVQIADVAVIAKLRGVQSVVLSLQPVNNVGSVTQKGVSQHRVDQVPGADGTGITIGVLSDSYNELPAASTLARAPADVASGDLPGVANPFGNVQPVVVVQELPTAGAGSDEGRAMLQLVHDIAPKARLGFATAFVSPLGFADNIRSLAGLPGSPRAVPGFNADIVVDDIIYFDEPMFSDGIIAQAVNDVTAAGKHYFSSAGNRPSTQAYAATYNRVAPGGTPTAGSNISLTGVDPTLYAGGFHNFRTDGTQDIAQTLRRTAGTGSSNARLVLQWDDPFDKITLGTQTFNVAASFTDPAATATLEYLIPLVAGVPTRIVVAAVGASAYDAILSITDPSNVVLINGQDTGTDETVFFTPTQTGNYKITLAAFAGSIGDFTLTAFANSSVGVTTEYNVLFFRADSGAFISAARSNAFLVNRAVVITANVPIPTGQSTVQMVIARSAGTLAKRLRYVIFDGSTSSVRPDEYISYQYPVTYGHNSAANGFGVAAFSAFRPYIAESFTSPGPVTIIFDANGNRLLTPEIRQQPAVSAMDGANTTFFGGDSGSDADSFPNFFGTSAAAPNAAAVAALVLQAKGGPGSLTVTQMKSILTGSTMPNDLDPYHSEAVINTVGGTLTITIDANSTASSVATAALPLIDPNVFKVSYSGSGSVASISLNGANGNTTGGSEASPTAQPGLVFDNRALASNGVPFSLGALNGLTAGNITATLGATAPAPAVAGQSFTLGLGFAAGSFSNGKSFGFNIDRDELVISALGSGLPAAGGNSADLFGANVSIPEGVINPGGVTVTVTMADASTATGTFVNNIGRGYSPLTGYGFLNAQAAVGLRTPSSVPDGPLGVTAVAGNTQITVAFSPPAANGGSAIFSYTATCGSASTSGPASPLVVTGLTNGVGYLCIVTATNATGTSAPSAPAPLTTPIGPSSTVLSGPAGSTFGQSVSFVANVTGSAPTGTVAFKDGTTVIAGCGTVMLVSASATCTSNSLAVGPRSLTAEYAGDAGNTPSTSAALTHTVAPAPYAFSVAKSGAGTGTVTSAPAGINCGVDCDEIYLGGTVVTLTAAPATGSAFAGWSLGTGSASCTGTGTCVVTVNAASSITATFVKLITFNVVLEGVQQVPRAATPALGSGTVVVNTVANTLTYTMSYSDLLGTFSVAHFHGPAARGAAAGVKIDITANPNSGTVTYLEADEADIVNGLWYYNLHTSAFGGGEIRGQLDNQGAGCGLDIDVDSKVQAGTDGLLIVRYLLGLRGAALVGGVLGSPTALRIDPAKIETVLQRLVDAKRLDIDGNNATEAQTDGLLLLRAMLGFTGTSVTNNALGTGTPTRGDWPAIRSYLTDSCKLVLP